MTGQRVKLMATRPNSALEVPMEPFETLRYWSKINRRTPRNIGSEVEVLDDEDLSTTGEESRLGFRSWYVKIDAFGSPYLVSPMYPFLWEPRQVATASCHSGVEGKGGSHRVPDPRCSCGIYFRRAENSRNLPGVILGSAYGYGRSMEHEDGFRSAYSYPRAFTGISCSVCCEIHEIDDCFALRWNSGGGGRRILGQTNRDTETLDLRDHFCVPWTQVGLTANIRPLGRVVEALESSYQLPELSDEASAETC